ncbi:MAG: hypothetical protein U5K37_01805 [Natrialbaceae archaeon]|nr:hypothetical protein [Natrialbaceae archaeon]
MATTRHQSADADDPALERADFVHCVTRADGDGIAAAAILAGALEAREIP